MLLVLIQEGLAPHQLVVLRQALGEQVADGRVVRRPAGPARCTGARHVNHNLIYQCSPWHPLRYKHSFLVRIERVTGMPATSQGVTQLKYGQQMRNAGFE